MIEIKKLKKAYKTGKTLLPVLKGIDLIIQDGELVSIMGSSGSGKSTLLNVLGVLDGYDSGEYYLGATLVKNLTEKQGAYFRNQHIGFVFQSFNLLGFKNAMENVALPLYYQKVGRKKRNRLAMQYLERIGLSDRALHMPNELSGGQKQRVAIARALITNPTMILADEPTGALDSVTSQEVMDIFKEVNDQGKTVIIVTHEDDISKQTKRIIRLKDGLVINNE